MKYSINNPPIKYKNDPRLLEEWKERFRIKRRARERRPKGTPPKIIAHLPCIAKATQMMWTSRKRAQRKKLEWKLSTEWIRTRLAQGHCEVTGIAFDMSKGNRRQKPFAPSLHRVDCKQGYTEANVQVVVWIHNQALSDWGVGALHQYIKLYLSFLKNKQRT